MRAVRTMTTSVRSRPKKKNQMRPMRAVRTMRTSVPLPLEYIPESIPSVCTTIFKRIAGLCFYAKSLMLYINRFVSLSSTN